MFRGAGVLECWSELFYFGLWLIRFYFGAGAGVRLYFVGLIPNRTILVGLDYISKVEPDYLYRLIRTTDYRL